VLRGRSGARGAGARRLRRRQGGRGALRAGRGGGARRGVRGGQGRARARARARAAGRAWAAVAQVLQRVSASQASITHSLDFRVPCPAVVTAVATNHARDVRWCAAHALGPDRCAHCSGTPLTSHA